MSGIFLPQHTLLQKPPVGARFNPNHASLRGLQALYVFNEGGGTVFAEASMQHPAASIVSGSGAPACWKNGLFGPSVQLTNSIGYISAGNICDNLANFTVSLWFNTGATAGNPTVVGKWASGGYSTGQGWGVSMDGTDISVITQLNGGSTYNQIAVTTNYNNSKWHHGVFTVSNYVAKNIYIDGVQVATSTIGSGTVTTTTNSGNLTFGSDASGSDIWSGNLDLVGIWNRVLSVDEIERLYIDPFYFMSPGGRSFISKGRVVKALGAVQTLTPDGIASQGAYGAPGIAENVLPLGIITGETFGAPATATNNARNLFPTGIATAETEGATLFNADLGPLGITSGEAEGTPTIALNLHPLGLTSSELLGALQTALATHNPINIPLRRRSAFTKPSPGTILNAAHPLAQGLAAGWVFNEGGGFSVTELLSGASCGFAGSPLTPAWQSGQFGPAVHFPGSSNDSRIVAASQPAFTNLGLNGPMSVSFWYNYDAAQLALPTGATVMGKSDSTDGTTGGFTHGWNINSDNWHLVSGSPLNSGTQNLKLEFEFSAYNKQGGIPAPTTPGVWHHIVITTAGGASTPSVNDYAIYLDGVLQQNIFFVAGTGTGTVSDAGYNLALGSHPSGSSPFIGYLDTVLLYNRVLTSCEAQQLYTDPFCFMKRRTQRLRATHSTASLSITPLGIVSAQQLGANRIAPAQTVSALGITSDEKPGALRAAIATIQDLYPGAIVSQESPGNNSVIIAVPIGTPRGRILNPAEQYRIFNLTIEERTL